MLPSLEQSFQTVEINGIVGRRYYDKKEKWNGLMLYDVCNLNKQVYLSRRLIINFQNAV